MRSAGAEHAATGGLAAGARWAQHPFLAHHPAGPPPGGVRRLRSQPLPGGPLPAHLHTGERGARAQQLRRVPHRRRGVVFRAPPLRPFQRARRRAASQVRHPGAGVDRRARRALHFGAGAAAGVPRQLAQAPPRAPPAGAAAGNDRVRMKRLGNGTRDVT
eukprot:2753242-Pyramimonas_sp.AAC.1